MRSLFVSAALAFIVGGATAAAQTPTPGSSTASPQSPAPPGQAQPPTVTPPTISAFPYGPINATGTTNAYVSAEATGRPAVFIGSDLSPYGIVGTFTNHPLGFRTNNIVGMFIDTTGRVGIGTTTPTMGRLHVESADDRAVYGRSPDGQGVLGHSDTAIGVYGLSYHDTGVRGVSAFGWGGYFSGGVRVDGVVCAGNVSCSSDARLKQDITPLSYGLREVLRLRPVRWKWKDTTTTQLNLGLIAQDVEPVLPELILHNVDKKGALGLNYFGFVPVLINAIQEQQDTITALKAENASRKAENTSLETRVRALEQALHRLLEPR